ncbi:MAG: flagellar biosynthesis protein FlhF, partial [Lachnospiraceae bacterium]|nr:flagellar biosynthesis protein FlhF [Lachnospiraceae bacterium]
MIIKKYTAKTEDDAVNAAKKDLGNGIVIMNVKAVKPSGLFRFFKSNQVEVTVALEEEKEKIAASKKEKEVVAQKEEPRAAVRMNAEVKHPVDEIGQKLDSLQSLLEKQIQTKTEEEKPKEEEKEENIIQPKEEDKNARFMKLLHNAMVDNEVSEEYANQIMDGLEKNLNNTTTIEHLLSSIY